MFWRVQGYQQTSPIEGILDKGEGKFSLEQLLDVDDLIQVHMLAMHSQIYSCANQRPASTVLCLARC